MAIGADVAAAEPAPVGTIGSGTKVRVGVDTAPASPGKGDHGWRRLRRLGTPIGFQLTGLAKRFVDQPDERFGLFGAPASTRLGLQGGIRHTRWVVGQPDMKKQADQDENNQQELVQQRVGCHDGAPFSRS